MSLLQKACETFDCFAHLAGVEEEGKTPLAPISHVITSAAYEITLDKAGHFITAQAVDKERAKTVIPVTEDSAGRTSAPSPHPLCEQLGYLNPANEEKYAMYLQLLEKWTTSAYTDPKLPPILQYVKRGYVIKDLTQAGLLEFNEDGSLKNEKLLVRWRINGLGEQCSGPCWTDCSLQKKFTQFYISLLAEKPKVLCQICGKTEVATENHPKGMIPINGNAKLISANDLANFTFMGRFTSAAQAATISYSASQKAHNALRWLAANQGVRIGERTFLCWNPQGLEIPALSTPMSSRFKSQPKPATAGKYRQQLAETLKGWKTNLPSDADVVIAAFDAATSGRLALTYYNELKASDFLDRLYHWDATCCWENGSFGVQSPSIYALVNCGFGNHREGRLETDKRILRQQAQRLIACRIDRAAFPYDVKNAIVNKASRLILYEEKFRHELLFTACAAINKYRYDHMKEEWTMALDTNNTNRSYLFGRLLALAEAVESSTYNVGESRETNAMRMQSIFVQRPMFAWAALEGKLNSYYARLSKDKPGLLNYFKNQIQEIVDKLPADSEELNRRLDDVYLIGYYHQRAYRKNKEAEENEQA